MNAIEIIRRYRPESAIISRGNWVKHSCIIETVDPHHNHGDRNPSAGLNILNGRYTCFAYLDHSIPFNKLKQIMHLSYDFQPIERPLPSDFQKTIKEKLENTTQELSLKPYKKTNLSYMTEDRGFLKSTIEAADIRYDAATNRIVIPVYEYGEVVGIQKRAIGDIEYQKYVNSRDFEKRKYLYHIAELDESKPLLVFESVMSVMRAYDYGITNAVSTFGSHMSRYQASQISRFKNVCIWYDGDKSGVLGARQAMKQLSSIDLRVVDSTDLVNKDIADISQKDAMNKIASALKPIEYEIKLSDVIRDFTNS